MACLVALVKMVFMLFVILIILSSVYKTEDPKNAGVHRLGLEEEYREMEQGGAPEVHVWYAHHNT